MLSLDFSTDTKMVRFSNDNVWDIATGGYVTLGTMKDDSRTTRVNSTTFYNLVLHETGHVFGIDDAYWAKDGSLNLYGDSKMKLSTSDIMWSGLFYKDEMTINNVDRLMMFDAWHLNKFQSYLSHKTDAGNLFYGAQSRFISDGIAK